MSTARHVAFPENATQLSSPTTLRPPSIVVPDTGVGGPQNTDQRMLVLPLESSQALSLQSPAVDLEDERSESSKLSDVDALASENLQRELKGDEDEGPDDFNEASAGSSSRSLAIACHFQRREGCRPAPTRHCRRTTSRKPPSGHAARAGSEARPR